MPSRDVSLLHDGASSTVAINLEVLELNETIRSNDDQLGRNSSISPADDDIVLGRAYLPGPRFLPR
jgi:hypothetical protein